MDPFGFKVIFIIFLVFVPLERLFAMHPQQKVFRRDWGNDVIFLFLNGMLIKLGLLGLVLAVIFAATRSSIPGRCDWDKSAEPTIRAARNGERSAT